MKSISLAIPFYNTSKFFLDCIKYSIDNEFVSEIVVNDDCSNSEEWKNLNVLVKTLGSEKIKIFRNDKNVKAFRNKYITVKKCTNEWVYLLDSDNYPFENNYDILKEVDQTLEYICYSPCKLFCKYDHQYEYQTISDYLFKYDLIGIEESKDAIFKKTKWFDWFLNTGNYFFNRNFYLDSLKEAFLDESVPLLDADTAAAFYFWLKNNGQFKVTQNLSHNHRLRDDSNWYACGQNSQLSVDYYKELITDL
jgi:hypothetical protein